MLLRYTRSCSRSEITAVGVSAGPTPSVYAIYPMTQASQSWIDVFDLTTQNALCMVSGSHAIFSPQGDRLATLKDMVVKLSGGVEYHHASVVVVRDLAGKAVAELKDAHAEPLAWSRDGRTLAARESAAPCAGRVSVWDVASGARTGRVLGHIDAVTHAAFGRSKEVVTLSRDGTARVTNPATAKTASRLEADSGNPRALAVTADGATVASVWGNTVQLWLPRANHVTSYNLNTARPVEGWPLCISPDCRYMACRTEQGFDVMDVASGETRWEEESRHVYTAGAFSADSKVLVLGTMDGAVQVWDLA